MKTKTLSIPGLILITPQVFQDDRGFFMESYRQPLFKEAGIFPDFVQDNLVKSQKDTLRGLHFQRGEGQHKLISVVHGKIFDVAVDIRKESPTFGKWEGVYLDDRTREQFFVPAGFAHGYLVISEEAIVQYKVSPVYDASMESGFRWDDPLLDVKWPIQADSPILSQRDKEAPLFEEIVSSL